ncbi:glycine amidinotransferase [Streptomyces albireticuli]|uniref:Glycine amidinotransferase n=1 Tax=Streptomyces albireticuli TaxID=1940 RepID=A0A2A2DA47_9ACTN|nr:glycine amidinotransferase [Streptomyces albireticuli]MCD9140958.1 glycine amidinotransferase [Streptomyces albireticuli]MCD9161080.1 glycine amidinotransferase [Streptomyces albireticuli]MCD9190862.1 glycine amidinotransferase [Streptomyces albireticuli]PAU48306.1 glycine amidinotransferase [Streptomyces albireticuli]
MNQPAVRVNSWNEWDPLREIVVGVADNACFEPGEPGYRPALRDTDAPFPTGPKPAEMIDRANAQLDGLAAVLEAQGVTVRRPDAIDLRSALRTPTFEVDNQYCVVCPRDVMITLGNEIVEASMSRRARYFEYQAYRTLVYEYWNADPNMVWTVAPKPSMADSMYRQDFWDWPLAERHARMHESEFCVTQDEVVFDAADMNRFGRDIVVQESMTTNRAGIRWLKRHLEPRGFRVHPVHFPLDFFPSHIDCTFVPLRPGLILTNPERPLREGEEQMFLRNDWELVDVPQPTSNNEEMPRYCQSSKWLSMNVLSVSPTKVVCEEREKPLQDLLDKLGFEVLPVPFRDVFEYGGSLHCATWDVNREGAAEDYFPHLDYTPVV